MVRNSACSMHGAYVTVSAVFVIPLPKFLHLYLSVTAVTRVVPHV